MLYILSYIVLFFAISLGVGSSTIAIVNFFRAIADGTIDPSERRIMGVTYHTLRVAMVVILIMYVVQLIYGYAGIPTFFFGTTASVAVGLLVVVLYANAILMTYKIMPSNFGPAIQATSWYTLGVTSALATLSIYSYSLVLFVLAYACALTAVTAVINVLMHHLNQKKTAPAVPEQSSSVPR